MQDDIATLFAYDRWANGRMLDACRKLTADQFDAEPAPGWSSVRSTVAHIALATEFNLRALAGDPDERVPTEAELATVDDAARLLDRAHRRFEELRPALAPVWLDTLLTLRAAGRAFTLPRGDPAARGPPLDLPPRADRLEAQTVRDRTTDHGLLLVGAGTGPAGVRHVAASQVRSEA